MRPNIARYFGLGALILLASDVEPSPSWFAQSDQAEAQLGLSVAGAGDVNRDGFADVLAGAPRFTNGEQDEGAVFLWLGGPQGLGATGSPANADWRVEGDQASGDMDGNGFWFGGTGVGRSVAAAGDVNGDGFADVIVGAPFYDNGGLEDNGKVLVYLGSAAGPAAAPAWTATMQYASALFGSSVAGAGDVNNDGFDDIIVGAPGCTFEQPCYGARPTVYVWFGGAPSGANGPSGLGPNGTTANADWIAQRDPGFFDIFGIRVAGGGDFNGDGFDDVVISTNTGVMVYIGTGTGPRGGIVPLPPPAVLPPAWSAELGGLVTSGVSAGDVNDDGYDDLLVGVGNLPPYGQSAIFVWYGGPRGSSLGLAGLGPNGTASNADWMMNLVQDDPPLFGGSVAAAGDVSGDGIGDIVVGASSYDGAAGVRTGKAFLWHGSASGLTGWTTTMDADVTSEWSDEGSQAEGQFGMSVSGAGDVNGDGLSDIVIGAWRHTDGQAHEGHVFVYHGVPPVGAPRIPPLKTFAFDWFVPLCIDIPWADRDVPGFPGLPKPNCPPPPDCRACFTPFAAEVRIDPLALRRLVIFYGDLYRVLAASRRSEKEGPAVHAALQRLSATAARQVQFRDTAFRSVSDLTPPRWGRLLQAATALELETRLPKLRSMRVRSGQRADASLSGVARLHFRRVQEGGVASLRVEPGIPALVEGFEPAWPAVTYAFDFSGRLNETGHVDLTLNLRGMRFPTPLSAVRILEWDGASYQDITMRVDEHARTITGRTRRMARVVVLARTDKPR